MDGQIIKTMGWLSWLYAASFTFALGMSPGWAYFLQALFSLTIVPGVLITLGRFLDCWARTKRTIILLVLIHIALTLLFVFYRFATNQQIGYLPTAFSLLSGLEGLLCCRLGAALYRQKVLTGNSVPGNFILLGLAYILVAVFGYLILKLSLVLLTMALFYNIGKLLLRGHQAQTGGKGQGWFFKRLAYAVTVFILLVVAISVVDYYSARQDKAAEITYTRLLQEIDRDAITQVSISDRQLRGKLKDGQEFKVVLPQDVVGLIDTLQAKNIEINFEAPSNPPWWTTLLEE